MIDLTIIVPIYNTPMNLLERCVESIISQIDEKTELILVDDGSKEDYAKDLDSLGTKSKSIKVIHQSNKGEGGARNTGIENANGKYLMFVDSDDVVPQGWIEYALKLGKDNDADIVCGKFVQCKEIPTQEGRSVAQWVMLNDNDVHFIQRDQFLEYTNLIPNLPYIDRGACGRIYKRSLIGDKRFKVGVVLSTDQIFNNEVLYECKSYILTNEDCYYYIVNPDSVSHVYRDNAVEVMMASLQQVKHYLFMDEENIKAFSFHVLRDLRLGIQFGCFNNPDRTSFWSKYRIVKDAFNINLVKEARKDVSLKQIKEKKILLTTVLIKLNLPLAYTFFNMIVQKR